MGSPYYRDMDEPTSPAGGGHHRSRSASRPPHSMDYPSKCTGLVSRLSSVFSAVVRLNVAFKLGGFHAIANSAPTPFLA